MNRTGAELRHDLLVRQRRKCPVCGRQVVKRSNGKLYRHNKHDPKAFGRRPVKGFMCEGSGRKVGR